jgi:dTDP-4-dehydrorhamnose reductase
MPEERNQPIELWGGIEATINRVGDRFFSQLAKSGHPARAGDVERCAALGISALRYPILWERVAPRALHERCWDDADDGIARARSLNVDVIAGLLHHGSGPAYTSLVDPDFATKFASYAESVAQRYPWIERYTPVNEPLTTARFSGLYGVWYPHGRDERVFGTTLLAQCRATVLAMRAIRRVNPAAQLLQTEDLGKTYSTPGLEYQAAFQNELRWLSWDLLCGRVSRHHGLWQWLTGSCGLGADDLLWFADDPCTPEMLGVNHYVTSDRFLDERLENYPQRFHGGNGRQRYADIETARSLAVPLGGIRPLLSEAWERFGVPLAITEVHIDATRDDQIRWMAEIWEGATSAFESGIDIRAVTAWALFGSFDWNSLLTCSSGYYEPGAFDIRGGKPRETAVAKLMRQIARGENPSHPVLAGCGWWKRQDRFFSPPAHAAQPVDPPPQPRIVRVQPIMISGANGTLGAAFARLCRKRGLAFILMTREDLDIADSTSVAQALALHDPWAVVNASGYVDIDGAERDIARCVRENVVGPRTLAAACASRGAALLSFSSDMVFDGTKAAPYVETDVPAPLNVYGSSKAQAERAMLVLHPQTLVVRTSSFFGPWDESNYVTAMIRALRAGSRFQTVCDQIVSPTYVPDLVNVCLDLLVDREEGIWHLTNDCAVTWADFATMAAKGAGVATERLQPCTDRQLQRTARRPAYSPLTSERSRRMPPLGDALERYFLERTA